MKIKKVALAAVLTSLILTGCGASGAYNNGFVSDSITSNSVAGAGSYDSSFKGDYSYTESAPTDLETTYEKTESAYEQKLVYTCHISLETLNYSDTVKDIKQRIGSFGGFIESEYEYDTNSRWYYNDSNGTMHLRITVRIPSDRYDDFINSLEGDGKITSKESNVDNVTRSYYETTALIESLKIQEERLLQMLDVADTIEDMITVEKRLTEVQSQLNIYNTRLATYDLDVEYSTVNLNIDEVEIYTPTIKTTTFFDRLKNTIKDSWDSFWDILENLLFFIIRMIPIVIIFTPIVILIIFLKKKLKARRLKKKAEKEIK